MGTMRIFFTALFFIFTLTGCFPPTMPEKAGNKPLGFAPQKFELADFAKETEKLSQITTTAETGNEDKAEAHRRLAILYLIPKNPGRDRQKAVEELGKFLELAPRGLDQAEAADWVLALKTGEECRDLQEENLRLSVNTARLDKEKKKLAATSLRLAEEKEKLTAANAELTKTIERIKKLDLTLDKKRRDYLR